MKVLVRPSRSGVEGKWEVEISQSHQYFTLDYHASKRDALWMARMFRIALKKHDAQRKGK
jgi:hypothetical protein